MKLLLVIGTIVCFALAKAQDVEEYSEGSESEIRIGSIPSAKQLQKIIENLRDGLKDKYNHILLNTTIPFKNDDLGIELKASAVGKISGLMDFEIVKMADRFYNYTYTIQFPKSILIDLDSYSLDGTLHMIHVFGNGKLRLEIKNLMIDGYFKLNILIPELGTYVIKIMNMVANLSVDDISFEVTGWLNDEIRSEILSKLVNENLKLVLEEYKEEIGAIIGKLIVSLELPIKIQT